MDGGLTTYDSLLAENADIGKIVTPEMAQGIWDSNENTTKGLNPLWRENARKNIELYRKHGSLVDAFRGFGTDKAVIGVGAGPSFNKNNDVLLEIYRMNMVLPVEEQPFIIVASNKQFKPLVKMGVYPHFTMLVDAGDALYPQLCEGIPKWARDSILITGLHTSHKILKEWDRQGGNICFYTIGDEVDKEWFWKETGHDPERVHIQQGGNVLNTLWILCHRVFGSSTYIMTGNDLSFPYSKDKAERERGFYADGDYRLNILNKRDEAKEELAWMGFDLSESAIQPGRYLYDLKPFGVSKQLYVYKTWLEVQSAVWAEKLKFFVFNASESGVLGVLARSYDKASMLDKSNWYLIDDILPKRWLTCSLIKAAKMYLKARSEVVCQDRGAILPAAGHAGVLQGVTNTARPTDQLN